MHGLGRRVLCSEGTRTNWPPWDIISTISLYLGRGSCCGALCPATLSPSFNTARGCREQCTIQRIAQVRAPSASWQLVALPHRFAPPCAAINGAIHRALRTKPEYQQRTHTHAPPRKQSVGELSEGANSDENMRNNLPLQTGASADTAPLPPEPHNEGTRKSNIATVDRRCDYRK